MASAEFSKFADILSAIAQLVKNLFAMQKTQVQFPGWEDPLEKEMATHSCILAWGIPWTEEPGGLQSMSLQRVGCDLVTKQRQKHNVMQLHEPSSPGVKGSRPILYLGRRPSWVSWSKAEVAMGISH